MKKKKISNSFLFFFDFTTFPSSWSNRKIAQWSAPSPTPSPLHCIPYQATPPLPIEFRYFTTSCVLRKRSTAKVKFQNYDFKKDNPKLYAAPSEKWAKWAQRELRSFPTGFSSIFLSLNVSTISMTKIGKILSHCRHDRNKPREKSVSNA